MIDPTQAAGQPAPAQQQSGPSVCITQQPDGSFMVSPETPGGDEASEQQNGQPAPDIDAALALAKQMLGGAQDPKAADAQADQLFQAGFNGTAPSGQQG